MRELMTDFGYDGNSVPFVVGSALLALNGDETEYGKVLNCMVSIFKIWTLRVNSH